MENAEPTINEVAAESSAVDGGSGDLVPTIGIQPPEEAQKTEVDPEPEKKADAETKAGEKTAPAAEEATPEDKEVRFDKHPRFKALIDTNRELRETVATVLERLDKQESQKPISPQQPPPLPQDFMGLSNEELSEQLVDDPKGILSKIISGAQKQTQDAMMTQFGEFQRSQQLTTDQQVTQKMYDKYGDDNPDFWQMWDSGEIEQHMAKHPGHNAISAHQDLTKDSRNESVKNQIDKAVEKALKEEREKTTKNLKAKRDVTYLPGGPTEARSSEDLAPELKNTKKHGGMVSVLARRLKKRREQG